MSYRWTINSSTDCILNVSRKFRIDFNLRGRTGQLKITYFDWMKCWDFENIWWFLDNLKNQSFWWMDQYHLKQFCDSLKLKTLFSFQVFDFHCFVDNLSWMRQHNTRKNFQKAIHNATKNQQTNSPK